MTAIGDALRGSGHAVPRPDVGRDPQLNLLHWNHRCPHPTCATWVPNHRRACVRHIEET